MTEQAVNMEISTETCTRDLKKIVNLLHYFFRFRVFTDVSAATPILMFSLWSCRFVLLIFYAKVTVLMERMKYDRFLQVVAEHVTIIWPVLFDHLTIFFAQNTRRLPILSNVFPINFYRIRVKKKYKHMLVLKNKKESSKLREIASSRPLLLHAGLLV